jgi:hypothetical protein
MDVAFGIDDPNSPNEQCYSGYIRELQEKLEYAYKMATRNQGAASAKNKDQYDLTKG